MTMAEMRERRVVFHSFDVLPTDGQLNFNLELPCAIYAIRFEVFAPDLSDLHPVDRRSIRLTQVLLGENTHIEGPGVFSPFVPIGPIGYHPSKKLQLAFSTEGNAPCRIVGHFELIKSFPVKL
ncbi:MAG: hypothetical protein ACTS8S_02535 [Giesbergeria sp.]